MEDRGGTEVARALVRVDQDEDFALQRVIIGARRGEERGAFGGLTVERRLEEVRQPKPAFRSHVRV